MSDYGGLYGPGMHGFILDELELGIRAATVLDDENNGMRLPCLSMEVEHWHFPRRWVKSHDV